MRKSEDREGTCSLPIYRLLNCAHEWAYYKLQNNIPNCNPPIYRQVGYVLIYRLDRSDNSLIS